MRPTAIWQVAVLEALSTLRRSPVRTFLSILGIVVGSAGLVSILAISGGITSATVDQEASADSRLVRIEPRESELIEGVYLISSSDVEIRNPHPNEIVVN